MLLILIRTTYIYITVISDLFLTLVVKHNDEVRV